MSEAARRFGVELARAASGASGAARTVSAEVVDVTDAGVNLMLGGTLVTDVPVPDTYTPRAGDWVAVRPGSVPVVLWRLNPDPTRPDASTAAVAREVALDVQAVRAMTWGTGAPAGSGWMQATMLYVRKAADGKAELYAQVGTAPADQPETPTGAVPRPVTISPTSSGAWRGGRRDQSRDNPYQGDWTGGGNLRGGWFYGTSIAAACAGKTVAKMTVTVTRQRGAGVNSKRPVRCYLHGHTSPPSGQLDLDDGPESLLSLSVGATGTAALPASWRTKLAAGTARGLAIYADGASDYMSVTGGSIRIEFA